VDLANLHQRLNWLGDIPGTLIWYVDRSYAWNLSNSCIPNNPEYLLANLAVGGDWPDPPDSATQFPSYMEIDYIRAYKYFSNGGENLGGDVGTGKSFNPPVIDKPASSFYLGPILANPETVNAGGSINVNIALYSNDTVKNYNMMVYLYNYTTGSTGDKVVTSGAVVFDCNGGYVHCGTHIMLTVPGGTPSGYYRGSLGIWNSNWSSNLFWQDTVVMVGVGSNYIVGGKGSPVGSASSSPKVYAATFDPAMNNNNPN